MNEGKLTIAIDGPAGAGKSTIARLVAERLRYTYIDTGAMYRAVALCALKAGQPVSDELIVRVSNAIDVRLQCAPTGTTVLANGVDVSGEIRRPEVTRLVSQVARLAPVRAKMVQLQRQMAERGGVVMDGRDIASQVLPKADVKVFLTASLEERARRRGKELADKGYAVDLEALQAEIAARDKADMERDISPLVRVPEATLVDSTGLDIEAVVAAILGLCGHV